MDIHSDTVLRSIIRQLYTQCAHTPDALEKLFSENANGRRSPSLEQLISTLKSMIQSFDHAYIVFDALDECHDRRDFLKFLKELHGWGLGPLHLLATSRQEDDITRVLNPLVSCVVPMDRSFVDGDILVHVSKTLEDDGEFAVYSGEEREKIRDVLTKGAHGM